MNEMYEFKLPREAVQVILQGLAEMPLKVSGVPFGMLQAQIEAQDAAKNQPAADGGG